MARYKGPVCKLCRREGTKLFLKGTRCFTEKCAVERRGYPPGQHGQARPRISEYQTQLREKQKLKRIYGLLERQFRIYFSRADRRQGITGDNLIQLLERRLDNVAYRLGIGASRKEARQMVMHGHVTVNGRKVDVPSFIVRVGDQVAVKSTSRQNTRILASLELTEGREMPSWLEFDRAQFQGRVKALPVRNEIELPVNEQLVVELYSR